MTKKFSIRAIATAACILSGPSGVFAGGYLSPVVEAEPYVTPITPLDWSGAYVGGAIGSAFNGDDDVGVSDGERNRGSLGDAAISGLTYGAHIGYRWQLLNRFVSGAELGYQGSSADGGPDNAHSKYKGMLSVTGKTGILFGAAQNTLVYGSLGVGRAKVDSTISGKGMDYDGSFHRTVYILGLGVEHRLNAQWSITGEWQKLRFGKETVKDSNGFSSEVTPSHDQVSLGVNYRF